MVHRPKHSGAAENCIYVQARHTDAFTSQDPLLKASTVPSLQWSTGSDGVQLPLGRQTADGDVNAAFASYVGQVQPLHYGPVGFFTLQMQGQPLLLLLIRLRTCCAASMRHLAHQLRPVLYTRTYTFVDRMTDSWQ